MELNTKFKETDIGNFPIDWLIHSLAECSEKITDGEHQTPRRSLAGYYLLSARNIKNGRLDLTDVDYVEREEYIRIRQRCNPEPGDVLVSCSGTIGRVAIVPMGIECVMVRSAALIKPLKSRLDSKFAQYFLQSSIGQKQIFASLNQGAQANLFLGHINNLKIALPKHKKEQEAISGVLSDTDKTIEFLKSLLIKKRNIKQATMQQLLTGKTRLPGFIGEWAKIKLGEIAEIVGGGTPSTSDHRCWGSEITWFTPTEVGTKKYLIESNRKITTFGLKNSNAKILPPGTVLLTTRAGIGDVGILTKEACTNQGFQSIVVRKPNNNEYVYYLISTLKDKLIKEASGSTFLEVSPSKIRQMALNLPSCNEQNEIAKILSEIDLDIEKLESKLAKLKLLKQGMMQELLTGRIRLV